MTHDSGEPLLFMRKILYKQVFTQKDRLGVPGGTQG